MRELETLGVDKQH